MDLKKDESERNLSITEISVMTLDYSTVRGGTSKSHNHIYLYNTHRMKTIFKGQHTLNGCIYCVSLVFL